METKVEKKRKMGKPSKNAVAPVENITPVITKSDVTTNESVIIQHLLKLTSDVGELKEKISTDLGNIKADIAVVKTKTDNLFWFIGILAAIATAFIKFVPLSVFGL